MSRDLQISPHWLPQYDPDNIERRFSPPWSEIVEHVRGKFARLRRTRSLVVYDDLRGAVHRRVTKSEILRAMAEIETGSAWIEPKQRSPHAQ